MKKLNNDKCTSFVEFCNIGSVKYWRQQLSTANVKNIKNASQLGGTRNSYTYGLLRFHNWLYNKKFEYRTMMQIGKNTLQQYKDSVRLDGIDHLFALSTEYGSNKTDFARLIKEYLAEISSDYNQSTVKNSMYAIRSFFRENESDITFQFRHRIKMNRKYPEQSLSLPSLKKILTVQHIQPIEKAVFMCKFQRGLDNSTFADRFNFEVWERLIEHFGSDNPELWDIRNVPVSVHLVRVKTGFMHTGFLDADAISTIIEYLKTRNGLPKVNRALFVDTRNNPITVNWIYRRFHKLVTRATLGDPQIAHNKCTPHEMRDLLKSTLIDSCCRSDVADHIIGHSPNDSYEKQAFLYPESLEHEFSKASERINLFTNNCKKHDLVKHIVIQDKSCLRHNEQIAALLRTIKTMQE